jgi:branched-chain amino acid transport system substrate-binding protein
MAAIYEVMLRLDGKIDGNSAMSVLKGMKLKSHRGPFEIDAQTRDPRQLGYVRKAEQRDGRVMNIEFEQIVRD